MTNNNVIDKSSPSFWRPQPPPQQPESFVVYDPFLTDLLLSLELGEFFVTGLDWWEVSQDDASNSEEGYNRWADLALDLDLELGGLPLFPELPRMPAMIANPSCPFLYKLPTISYPLFKTE